MSFFAQNMRLIVSVVAAALFVITGHYALGVEKSRRPLFSHLAADVNQSVKFVRLRDGKVLFERDAQKLVIPASVAKLATAAASLHYLSPHYQFATEFYTSGVRQHQRIKGHLIVKGGGDPLLISEKLWQVAADIRHLGIRTITGDIIIDNSLFDDDIRDNSREAYAQHSTNAYDAPLTAFGINFNTYAVALAPAQTAGTQAIAELDPYPLRGLTIKNKLKTISGRYGGSIRVSRNTDDQTGSSMVVSGGIPIDKQLKKVYRSVGDPVRAAGEQLRAFLNKEGIIVQGQVKSGKVPTGAKLLTTLYGYPLKRIIESLNKYSNNFIADTLVKKLAANDGSVPGTMSAGLDTIGKFLVAQAGIQRPFVLANGSGLDPRSQFSAAQLVDLLDYMHSRFDLFPEYLNSLPAAGLDGTMKDRFRSAAGDKLKGIVRAKTGTLTSPVSVATLAGYLQHPRHGIVAFAILENGVVGKRQPSVLDLRDRQDRALESLIQNF